MTTLYELVDYCRSKGHEVTHRDGSHLEVRARGSDWVIRIQEQYSGTPASYSLLFLRKASDGGGLISEGSVKELLERIAAPA